MVGSILLGHLVVGAGWFPPSTAAPVLHASSRVPSCCLGGEGRAFPGSWKASKNAREQPRIVFSRSLLGQVGRRAQGRRVIRKCSAVRWCLPAGWRRRRKASVARDSVRTPCTAVAATSSFWASGKSFKFPFFEKKESTFLSHTSLDAFPPAKPSRSLKRRGTTDTQLLQEAATITSFQIALRNLACTEYSPLCWGEAGFPSIAHPQVNATGSEIRCK